MIGRPVVATRCLDKIFPTFFPNQPSAGIFFEEAHPSRQADCRKDCAAVSTKRGRVEIKNGA
jgi:hypothetical protein